MSRHHFLLRFVVLTGLVLGWFGVASIATVAPPSSASEPQPNCSGIALCWGSDGGTGTDSVTGSETSGTQYTPQFYVGQIGYYAQDVGNGDNCKNSQGQTIYCAPCDIPSAHYLCFIDGNYGTGTSGSGADGALSEQQANNGLGIAFWYELGGADSTLDNLPNPGLLT